MSTAVQLLHDDDEDRFELLDEVEELESLDPLDEGDKVLEAPDYIVESDMGIYIEMD